MIEVKVGKDEISMTCVGDLKELTSEVMCIINGVYSRLKVSAEPKLGEQFRAMLTMTLLDPKSPAWRVNPGGDGSQTVLVPMSGRTDT